MFTNDTTPSFLAAARSSSTGHTTSPHTAAQEEDTAPARLERNEPLLRQIITPELLKIVKTLEPFNCKLVGGIVREYVLGHLAEDIDVCTTAEPSVVRGKLDAAGIKTIPTGIDFGTVTAVCNGKEFQITTLRRDIRTDGRHAEVLFGTSFEEDAQRRDFTFNALYMDMDGSVTDYFGGIEDLKAGQVRFIGDAASRIKEDYLRILRYFRFFARFGNGQADKITLAAISAQAKNLSQLSSERITAELMKLLPYPNARKTWELMAQTGVLTPIALPNPDLTAFHTFLTLFPHQKNPLLRLAALYHDKNNVFLTKDPRLCFSNKEKEFLHQVFKALKTPAYAADPKHQAYRLGKEVQTAALQIEAARTKSTEDRSTALEAMNEIANFTPPDFPLRGADLIDLGLKPGAELGAILQDVEDWWIENDFPTKDACLDYLYETHLKHRPIPSVWP